MNVGRGVVVHRMAQGEMEGGGGLPVFRIIMSFKRVYHDGVLLLVLVGLRCFLYMSSAGLVVVLVPGCCWASAFSV